MRATKLRKLQNLRNIDSMNKMPESAKALIEVYEQLTGTPYKGVGINTYIANTKSTARSTNLSQQK